MGRVSKIPKKYRDEITVHMANGRDSGKIKMWLEERDIFVHPSSVTRLLNQIKAERSEVAQRVYAVEVAKHANLDLNIISDIISKFYSQVQKSLEAEEITAANKLSQTLLAYIKTRIELSGINKETNDDEKLKEELLKKISAYEE